MMVASGKSKVGVGVIVGVLVIVGVGVIDGVGVIEGVGVDVGVVVAVLVGVGVSEGVGLGAVVWLGVCASEIMTGVDEVQPTTTKDSNATRKDKLRLIFVRDFIL